MRVQLARRFHNDAVTDVRRVRRKWVGPLFRLAGHADLPAPSSSTTSCPATAAPAERSAAWATVGPTGSPRRPLRAP